MEKAMRGEAVISSKGSNYSFSTAEKEEAGERGVVIPRPNGYTSGQCGFDRFSTCR